MCRTFYYNPPPFDNTASILRAATTLQFDNFRNWAVQYLEDMWSNDLADLSPRRLENAVEVVILGRKYDVPGALKRAFYELLRTSGLGYNGGGSINKTGDDHHLLMHPDDTRRLICAREKLSEAWLDTLGSACDNFPCPNAPKDGGASGQATPGVVNAIICPSHAQKETGWHKLVYVSGLVHEYMYDVLCGLKVLVDRDWKTEDGYCDDCSKMRRDAWEKQRVKLWKNLDLWLDL
jgi:hypothetical protein